MPQILQIGPRRLSPLDLDTLERYKIAKFATEWLSQALRPSFKYIAPGLSTLSPELLIALYGVEPANSPRQTQWSFPDDDFSSLLFPSDVTIPVNISSTSTEVDIQMFERGIGRFTVGRRAGVYTDGFDDENADTVYLIHPSGRSRLMSFKTICPWDIGRGPRLAEILQKWTELVETGTWDVDENGVKTDIEWFGSHRSEMELDWYDIIEQETGIFYY